jgi:hypothetical protein
MVTILIYAAISALVLYSIGQAVRLILKGRSAYKKYKSDTALAVELFEKDVK